jgi:hypothetical protein
MQPRKVLYIAVCFGLAAGAASAQGRAERFVQRDGNGDGVLTPHEYQTTGGHPGNFRALDANGDGVLSRDEFLGRDGSFDDRAYEARKYESRKVEPGVYQDPNVLHKDVLTKSANPGFRNKDVNGDGVLSRREYGQASTFRRVDRNRDGVISEYEFTNPPPAPASRRARRVRG